MKQRNHPINGALSLLLITAFAILSLLLVLIGVRAYRAVTAISEENQRLRISFSYLANKVRSAPDGVLLETREGIPVLALAEQVNGNTYETLVYFSNGELREQFAKAGQDFAAENGEAITELEACSFSMEEERLCVSVVDSGGTPHTMTLTLPSVEQEVR